MRGGGGRSNKMIFSSSDATCAPVSLTEVKDSTCAFSEAFSSLRSSEKDRKGRQSAGNHLHHAKRKACMKSA